MYLQQAASLGEDGRVSGVDDHSVLEKKTKKHCIVQTITAAFYWIFQIIYSILIIPYTICAKSIWKLNNRETSSESRRGIPKARTWGNVRSLPGRRRRPCEPNSPAPSTPPPTSGSGWSSAAGTGGDKFIIRHQTTCWLLGYPSSISGPGSPSIHTQSIHFHRNKTAGPKWTSWSIREHFNLLRQREKLSESCLQWTLQRGLGPSPSASSMETGLWLCTHWVWYWKTGIRREHQRPVRSPLHQQPLSN